LIEQFFLTGNVQHAGILFFQFHVKVYLEIIISCYGTRRQKVFSYFGNQKKKTFGDLSCCFRYRSTLSGIVGFSIPYFSTSFSLFIFEKRTDRLGSKGGGICVYRTAMRELGPNRH
jgi:hypothetical protein